MKAKLIVCTLAAFVIGQSAALAAPNKDIAPVKDLRALKQLKEMSDALANAKSLTFDTTSMTPMRGPNGQWFHILTTSKVLLSRPAHLAVETGGDAVQQKITFDGNTYSVSVPKHHVYSQDQMPGSIDEMLASAATKGGNVFTFADVLLSDPYTMWAKSLDGAVYVGESERGKEKLSHLMLTSKSVDWEVWLDQKTHLPRIVYVKYTGVEKAPSVMIEFSKWKLNADIPAATFAFVAPKGAAKVQLKAPAGGQQ